MDLEDGIKSVRILEKKLEQFLYEIISPNAPGPEYLYRPPDESKENVGAA